MGVFTENAAAFRRCAADLSAAVRGQILRHYSEIDSLSLIIRKKNKKICLFPPPYIPFQGKGMFK